MKVTIFNFSLSVLCLVSMVSTAQRALPEGSFQSPLDIKPYITGTFAEPRLDHLHSGIDFGTNGRVGANVLAVADGYISRIKVSSSGYGRVIYLTHPNGYVSVYGHLNEFNVVVEDYVARKQAEKQSFEIEIFPDPSLFRLKKGDIVGYSGNTGASSGPHLHFELRNEKTERIINPFLLGITVPDEIPPVVEKIKVYPEGRGSLVNGQSSPAVYTFEKQKSRQEYVLNDTVKVTGSCSLGMLVNDYVSSTSNETGVSSWDMLVDGTVHFSCEPDSFAFDDVRMVNDMIDYPEFIASQTRFLMFRKSTGNSLNIYGPMIQRGIITFDQEKFVNVLLRARDFSGNRISVKLVIKGKPASATLPFTQLSDSSQFFWYNRPAHYQKDDITVDLDANTLFESMLMYCEQMNGFPGYWGALYRVGKSNVPMMKPMKLTIKVSGVPEKYLPKLLIARMQGPNNLIAAGGDYKDGYIQTSTYRFGDYVVVADTVAPLVKPIGFSSHKNINQMQTLRFYATDDLTGVKLYRAELNGKWILMEYDAKSNLLIIPIDENFILGKNELKIVVIDGKNNITEQRYTLIR